MIEIILIALYLFIVGFEIESSGALLKDNKYATIGDRIVMILFCMTIGAVTFPLTLGIKISKFLDRE